MSRLKKKTTSRGFTSFEFEDEYGERCSLQKSSLATVDAIWLGVDSPSVKIGPPWVDYEMPSNALIHSRMHLNRETAGELAKKLEHFSKTGDLS